MLNTGLKVISGTMAKILAIENRIYLLFKKSANCQPIVSQLQAKK